MSPLLASTALGLVAAWPVGALGFGLGRLVERLTDDPRPRAAAWSLAYALPAGALAATVALTFAPLSMPAPAVAASIVPGPARMFVVEMTDNGARPAAPTDTAPSTPPLLGVSLAWALVGLSTAGLLTRGWRWNQGRRRLAKVRAQSEPCQDFALIEAVRLRAARLGVKAPRVRVSADIAEPMLAGARRPVILLPKALVEAADTRRLALVCGHELAHLRRGDNWRIPAEEALAGLFWLTPPITALRGRMLAAREAVCDLTALDGAAPEARQDYARVLVEALKMNAQPSLTFESAFTGRDRNLVSLRLKAILQPRGSASAARVGLAFALGGVLTIATGAGSLALADQARRIAPMASAETESLAKAVAVLAHGDAVAPDIAAATPHERATRAAGMVETDPAVVEAAQAIEAAPAAEVAPAMPAAPASPAAPAAPAAPALMASPAPLAPVAPVAMAAVRPAPRPDAKPVPRAKPNVARRSVEVDVNNQKTDIDVTADQQVKNVTTGMTVFLGDVTVRGHLNPVLVTLKLDGREAPMGFDPNDLAEGAIQRLEFTDRKVSIDGKMTLNVVLKDTP